MIEQCADGASECANKEKAALWKRMRDEENWGLGHAFSHLEMVPSPMLGDSFGMGTTMTLELSADIHLAV